MTDAIKIKQVFVKLYIEIAVKYILPLAMIFCFEFGVILA
jgi:hypothetical protein